MGGRGDGDDFLIYSSSKTNQKAINRGSGGGGGG